MLNVLVDARRARLRRRLIGAALSLLVLLPFIQVGAMEQPVMTHTVPRISAAPTLNEPGLSSIHFVDPVAQARVQRAAAHIEHLRVWSEAHIALEQLSASQRIGVAVVDLATGEQLIDVAGDAVFTAASVYKLHAAYSMLTRVESGSLAPDAWVGGLPVYSCIESMIVWSANECSEAWVGGLTPEGLQADAQAIGASRTSYRPYDMRTTANDMAQFLRRLEAGELLSDAHTRMMRTHMRAQVWRDGIPAALEPAWTVENKVGFLDQVRNDAAIVTGEAGSFAVVILTESDDFATIRSAAAVLAPALEFATMTTAQS